MNTTTTYDTETSSVDCACYGNGTSIKYEYGDADRVDIIRHRTGSTQFLILDCEYDPGNNRLTEYEVRGNGRRRHMLRPWGFQSGGQGSWNTWADNGAALWTTYHDDQPTADYRMIVHPTLGTVPYSETSYTLRLAQRTPATDVKYFHTHHLGTTQAMTGASQAVHPPHRLHRLRRTGQRVNAPPPIRCVGRHQVDQVGYVRHHRPTIPNPAQNVCGDVNISGVVNVFDVFAVLDAIARYDPATRGQMTDKKPRS